MLHQELFHTTLHFGMTHDDMSKGSRHIEGTETLWRGRFPGQILNVQNQT